jgi:hypothetical protein
VVQRDTIPHMTPIIFGSLGAGGRPAERAPGDPRSSDRRLDSEA